MIRSIKNILKSIKIKYEKDMTNNKRLPKFYETFIPILRVLDNGGMMHYNEMGKRVRDYYYSDLPNELLDQKIQNGD